jgi:hypothetical protein
MKGGGESVERCSVLRLLKKPSKWSAGGLSPSVGGLGNEGGGGVQLRGICRANKRDGSPCTAPAAGANGFCWAHDPANAAQRSRIASKGGRGKGGGELPDLKKQLKDLAAGVLDGSIDRGRAAVANQIMNTVIRSIEQERKLREMEELAERLEALEEMLKARKAR